MTITANNPRIGWHNLVLRTTVFADQESALLPATHLANPATFLKWRGTSNDEQSIGCILDDLATVNYMAVYGHNFGSEQVTINFEYSDDGGSSWSVASPPTIPTSDGVIFREFDDVQGDRFRLRLEPSGDEYSPLPEAAVLYIGRVLRLERRLYVGHAPLTLSRKQTVTTGRSESGQFLGRTLISTFYETSLTMGNLDPEWYRENFDPFARVAATQPFFWHWRPGDYPEEAGYAWATSDVRPTNQTANGLMQVQFGIQGVS